MGGEPGDHLRVIMKKMRDRANPDRAGPDSRPNDSWASVIEASD